MTIQYEKETLIFRCDTCSETHSFISTPFLTCLERIKELGWTSEEVNPEFFKHFCPSCSKEPNMVTNWSKFNKKFTEREFRCKGFAKGVCSCGGIPLMNEEFMDWLFALRMQADFPFIIESGYRCPDYNTVIATTGRDGPHTTGKAVDIKIYGSRALRLEGLAIMRRATGLGDQQKGPYADRFVHLDTLKPEEHSPRPWKWTY